MDRRQKCILSFNGGWATDLGPSFPVAPQNGALPLPFLLSADNVLYELDGGPHKVGGSTRFNATAVSDGSNTIHGFIDFWQQGASGAETQQIGIYAGTSLYKSTSTGTLTAIKTGLEDNKEPCFAVFNDKLLWASNSTGDVPQSWDGAAAATSNLAGSPPRFAFMEPHKNRLWAAGVVTNPSRLYYTNALDETDWAGGGSIDIDPSDGDRIVGLKSHKNELLIFKGPNRLSIHRITGSAPSGSDAFARIPFVVGVGGINHNGIIRIASDLIFPDPRGIHSLDVTAAYGDYSERFLSQPISSYYQDSLNHSILNTCWGANYQTRGVAVWTFAQSGSTAKNIMLVLDYRFSPGRWISWGRDSTYVNAHSLGVIQINRVHRLHCGTTAGYIQRLDATDRSLPGNGAYSGTVKTPFLNFGSSATTKEQAKTFISLQPKGNYNMTFGWTRDTNSEETATVSQGGGDPLGVILLPWLILILQFVC